MPNSSHSSRFYHPHNIGVSRQFSQNTQIPNFIKIRPVEGELFDENVRKDRRTNVTELTVTCNKFSKASKQLILDVQFGHSKGQGATKRDITADGTLRHAVALRGHYCRRHVAACRGIARTLLQTACCGMPWDCAEITADLMIFNTLAFY